MSIGDNLRNLAIFKKKMKLGENMTKIQEDKIMREHDFLMKKMMKVNKQQLKQTVDIFLFKRYSEEEKIPEGRRIAFKYHQNNRYISKTKKIFFSLMKQMILKDDEIYNIRIIINIGIR